MDSSMYGSIPFPRGEEKCLSKGQMLTDRMMDYLAYLLFTKLGVDSEKYHLVPSFFCTYSQDSVDWTMYHSFEKVFMIMNHNNHWFLFVFEPKIHLFHLFDPLACEDDSPIDFELFPIGDNDVVEDYYGKIPHQGASKTNCGILTLMYLVCQFLERPIDFDASPTYINKVVRPFFSKLLWDSSTPIDSLF